MKKVLVVDDDPDIRTVLRITLAKEGFEVHEAGDGMAALGMMRSKPYDLLVTDVFMPEMGGLSAMEMRPAWAKDVPVFVISGGADRSTEEALSRARRLGAVRTFSKPFDVGAVAAAAREVAGLPALPVLPGTGPEAP